jgi:hypothetical protein
VSSANAKIVSMTEPAEITYSDDIRTNVELLEQQAVGAAQQEIDRMNMLDQKASGLIAAGLVLVAAGVAFATGLGSLRGGSEAHSRWAMLLVLTLVLLFVSIACATYASRPQPAHIVIDMKVLEKWATPRFLDRDPTLVRGELMQAGVAAVGAARVINAKKGNWLRAAFAFFGAAIVATVVLGSAVAIRSAESSKQKCSPKTITNKSQTFPARANQRPLYRPSPRWTQTHRCFPHLTWTSPSARGAKTSSAGPTDDSREAAGRRHRLEPSWCR